MLRPTLTLVTLLLAGTCAHAADTQSAELPPVKPGWTLLPDEVPDAKVERIVGEDDHIRVEELRVRGQTQKVTVQLKNSVFPDYEILISEAGYALSPTKRFGQSSTEGPTGKRVWRVLDF